MSFNFSSHGGQGLLGSVWKKVRFLHTSVNEGKKKKSLESLENDHRNLVKTWKIKKNNLLHMFQDLTKESVLPI